MINLSRCYTMLLFFVLLTSLVGAQENKTPAEPLSLSAVDCGKIALDSSAKCVVARDISLNALRNAMAVQDEQAGALVLALKSGNNKKIQVARRNLKHSIEESDEVVDMTELIVGYALEAESMTSAVNEQVKLATSGETSKKAGKAEKRAKRLAHIAENVSRKACLLADKLKKKWLIPKESD